MNFFYVSFFDKILLYSSRLDKFWLIYRDKDTYNAGEYQVFILPFWFVCILPVSAIR